MRVKEIELAIGQLPTAELSEFAAWFEEFWAEKWDKQIEADVRAGRLDALIQQAEREFAAGRCKPLKATCKILC
ncbi:MAG: hypothetical protein HZC40_25045 [Chloroflexi bacterium]|nr:hypothetical protein [Chloroflexota bacterium]